MECIKNLTPSNSTYPTRFRNDETGITDPKLVANKFSNFFTSCVKDPRGELEEQTTDFRKLIS